MLGIFGSAILPTSPGWMWIGQLAVLAIGAPLLRVRGAMGAVLVTALVATATANLAPGVGLALATICGALAGMLGHQIGHKPSHDEASA